MTRPQGQPGTFKFGCGEFTAILDRDGGLWWRTQEFWHQCSDRLARRVREEHLFVPDPVPEWVEACDHPTICDTEADCTRLAIEDDRLWRDQ